MAIETSAPAIHQLSDSHGKEIWMCLHSMAPQVFKLVMMSKMFSLQVLGTRPRHMNGQDTSTSIKQAVFCSDKHLKRSDHYMEKESLSIIPCFLNV
jgi:hypothetical protein